MLNLSAKTVTGQVTDVRTVAFSTYGNPTKRVTLLATAIDSTPLATPLEVKVTTQANSQIAFAIGNGEYRDTPHTYELTSKGRISRVAVAAEPAPTAALARTEMEGGVDVRAGSNLPMFLGELPGSN